MISQSFDFAVSFVDTFVDTFVDSFVDSFVGMFDRNLEFWQKCHLHITAN